MNTNLQETNLKLPLEPSRKLVKKYQFAAFTADSQSDLLNMVARLLIPEDSNISAPTLEKSLLYGAPILNHLRRDLALWIGYFFFTAGLVWWLWELITRVSVNNSLDLVKVLFPGVILCAGYIWGGVCIFKRLSSDRISLGDSMYEEDQIFGKMAWAYVLAENLPQIIDTQRSYNKAEIRRALQVEINGHLTLLAKMMTAEDGELTALGIRQQMKNIVTICIETEIYGRFKTVQAQRLAADRIYTNAFGPQTEPTSEPLPDAPSVAPAMS